MERLIPFRPVPLNVVSELYRLSQCFFAPTEGMEKVKAEIIRLSVMWGLLRMGWLGVV